MELYAVFNYKNNQPVEVLQYADTEELAESWVKDLNADGVALVNLDHPLKAANYLNSALKAELPFDNKSPLNYIYRISQEEWKNRE